MVKKYFKPIIETIIIGILYGSGAVQCLYDQNIISVILILLATIITYHLAVKSENVIKNKE